MGVDTVKLELIFCTDISLKKSQLMGDWKSLLALKVAV